jgi:hypothetical protein
VLHRLGLEVETIQYVVSEVATYLEVCVPSSLSSGIPAFLTDVIRGFCQSSHRISGYYISFVNLYKLTNYHHDLTPISFDSTHRLYLK